jgi:hypothetical protein
MNHLPVKLHIVVSRKMHQWRSDIQNHCSHTLECHVLRSLFFAISLLLMHPTSAETGSPANTDLLLIVEAALKKLDATSLDDDWYFTMAVVEEDGHQIIQSDPYRDKYQKRQLVSVNGVLPDEEHLASFHDKEVERIDAEDPDAAGYEYMVDAQTLQLLETGDGFARFSFLPRVKTLENSRDKIRGSLLFNTASQQIDQIEITNTAQLSPAFSVTVDSFRLTLQFQQEQGAQLLSRLESDTAGKAGFVKSFDVQFAASFSDYKRAVDEPARE